MVEDYTLDLLKIESKKKQPYNFITTIKAHLWQKIFTLFMQRNINIININRKKMDKLHQFFTINRVNTCIQRKKTKDIYLKKCKMLIWKKL